MKYLFNQISKRVSTAIALLFNASKTIDYKTVSQYILKVNQSNELKHILHETSNCLKDLVNYRLFAVAIKKDDILNIWLDPLACKNSFKKTIIKDLIADGDKTNFKINYLNESFKNQKNTLTNSIVNIKKYNSYPFADKNYKANLYIIPENNFFNYHDELMEIIINTIKIALSNIFDKKQLKFDAVLDPLTGSFNRREFEILISSHIANSYRYNKKFSILMFDLDHFKNINDKFGHQAGDEVLKMVSQTVHDKIRTGDNLCRFGGEEFIVLLPESDKDKAIELAERLRAEIEKICVNFEGNQIKVTASFGVASLKENSTRDILVKEADLMMYKAKRSGRNIVMPGLIKLCPNKKQLVLH